MSHFADAAVVGSAIVGLVEKTPADRCARSRWSLRPLARADPSTTTQTRSPARCTHDLRRPTTYHQHEERLWTSPTGAPRIDALDEQIVKLLNERAACAIAIGEIKREQRRRYLRAAAREQQVIEHARKSNPGPLASEQIQDIYERIMDIMRSLQRPDHGVPATAAAACRRQQELAAPGSHRATRAHIRKRALSCGQRGKESSDDRCHAGPSYR